MRRIVILAMVLAAATVGAFEGLPAAADISSSQISVVSTPSAEQPECTPAKEKNATGTVTWPNGAFQFTIDAKAPICETVTAVVYLMPFNPGWRWPQHKIEEVKFQVPAGITTITYTFACNPQQFDVITGEAPNTIDALFGPMHGPLLFEDPYSSTFQFPKPGCTTPTTTPTTTTTTTTTTTSTTTTTLPTVASSTTTTITGVGGSTTSVVLPTTIAQIPTSVAGITTTIAPDERAPISVSDTEETGGGNLPNTGFSGGRMILIALGCIAFGLVTVRIARIRSRA